MVRDGFVRCHDALVEQAAVAGPKQVEIESKFIEITQNNLKELGFDWLLGQFNPLAGAERILQVPWRGRAECDGRLVAGLLPNVEHVCAHTGPAAMVSAVAIRIARM